MPRTLRMPAAARFAPRAFLLVAAISGLALAAPAGASAATARPAASMAPAATTTIFHTCAVIGSPSGGVEGVHCADLLNENGEFVAQNEVLCQNTSSGAVVDCGAIFESVETASTDAEGVVGVEQPVQSGECGAIIGHSDCGARRVENRAPAAGSAVPGGSGCQAWEIGRAHV